MKKLIVSIFYHMMEQRSEKRKVIFKLRAAKQQKADKVTDTCVSAVYGSDISLSVIHTNAYVYAQAEITLPDPNSASHLSLHQVMNHWQSLMSGSSSLCPKPFTKIAESHEIFPARRFMKEVTESSSAYLYLSTIYPKWKFTDKNSALNFLRDNSIRCYVIGDGTTPKTASLFYYGTSWQVWSIDPELRDTWITRTRTRKFARITCLQSKAEDVDYCADPRPDTIVIVSVHGHADVRTIVSNIRDTAPEQRLIVLSIPCCFVEKQILTQEPIIKGKLPVFNTIGVSSDVYIWEF